MLDYKFEEVTNWEKLEQTKPDVASQVLLLPIARIFGTPEEVSDGDHFTLLTELNFASESDGVIKIEDAAAVCRVLSKQFARKFQDSEPESIDEFIAELEALNKVRFGIREGRSAIGDAMVLLMRDAKWDLVALAQSYLQTTKQFALFWRAISYAIPYGNCDNTDGLIAILGMAVENNSEGGSGFTVYSTARQLGRNDDSRGRILMEKLKNEWNYPAAAVVPSIAIGLAKHSHEEVVEELFGWLDEPDENSVAAGIRALNGLECDAEQQGIVSSRLATWIGKPTSSRPKKVLAAIADSLKKLTRHGMPENELKQWVEFLRASKELDLQQRTANLLLNIQDDFGSSEWFRDAVLTIYRHAPVDIQLLHELCLIVNDTTRSDDNFSFATTAIETWLLSIPIEVKPPAVTEAFLFVFQGMQAKSIETLNRLLTRWLASDDRRLHDAAEELGESAATSTMDGGASKYRFAQEELESANEQDLGFLVRKAMSLLDEPNMLASMLFSLIGCETLVKFEERKRLVAWCFFNFVGYNFPLTSRKFLNAKLTTGTKPEKEAAQHCLDAMEQYYAPLDADSPKELMPPASQAMLYAEGFQAVMRESEKKAMAASPLLSIMPSLRLLFGSGYIYAGNSNFQSGKANLQTGKFAEHSIEWEPPRQHVIDPVGFEHQRRTWRTQKREEIQCN